MCVHSMTVFQRRNSDVPALWESMVANDERLIPGIEFIEPHKNPRVHGEQSEQAVFSLPSSSLVTPIFEALLLVSCIDVQPKIVSRLNQVTLVAIRPIGKQSFQDGRSQAGAWERGIALTRRRVIVPHFPAISVFKRENFRTSARYQRFQQKIQMYLSIVYRKKKSLS